MQPTLCSKCKKNVAVVFISRQNEKGEMVNEGLCLKCAAQLGLPQVEEMMKRMGISPEDLENINNEMMQAFGGAEELSDMPAPQDEDDEDACGHQPQPAPAGHRAASALTGPSARRSQSSRTARTIKPKRKIAAASQRSRNAASKREMPPKLHARSSS